MADEIVLDVQYKREAVTWADIELFDDWQKAAEAGAVPVEILMQIKGFLDRCVVGGAAKVPMIYTGEVFSALMAEVMSPQGAEVEKN